MKKRIIELQELHEGWNLYNNSGMPVDRKNGTQEYQILICNILFYCI